MNGEQHQEDQFDRNLSQHTQGQLLALLELIDDLSALVGTVRHRTDDAIYFLERLMR
jgi:hypothetical protein